ncbi:MAG: riboflavin synthase [Longimicrobiales bacterium]|jgi:riboflavin synthase
MFSGIVEAVGTIREVADLESTRRFRVEVPEFASELALGDSVAVDGACLTVTDADEAGFWVDVIGTTLERTVAGRYEEGSRVNLERALRMGSRLDGHLVQGHVDTIGHLMSFVKDGEFWLLDFEIPERVLAETIEHGSITLNGVSLTVSELLAETGVRIGIIPFTHAHTNLGSLAPGDPVNVEGDLIGKYVARIVTRRENPGPSSGS